ncbi:hypothetical protein ACSQ67_013198 [Phaseolus vulgaris]
MRREGEAERENVPLLTTSSSRRRVRTRLRTTPDSFLSLCRCFSFLVVLSSIFCIAVNIFDGIFRCYAVFIACFVVLAETEWSFIIKFWKVVEYWVARGILQIFVAVMTRAFPDYSGERKVLIVLQSIACYMLLACGVIYVVSGILCFGFLKRSLQKQEISREQAAKDLEELERRREELEQLLITE